jgi:hypothetical protein
MIKDVEERDAEIEVRRAAIAANQQSARHDRDDVDDDEWPDTRHLPGPDITKDATYRRDVIAYLTRIGRCRPEWRRL